MIVKTLRAILANMHDECEVFVTIDGYDKEVGCTHINEDQGYIALEPTDYDDDDAEDGDPGQWDDAPSDSVSCALPENPPNKVGIRDI